MRTKTVSRLSALAATVAVVLPAGGLDSSPGRAAEASTAVGAANATFLGPNVYVFDPAMPAADIERTATDIFRKMESNQFGPERYALLFKPGTYNVTFNVGFYTQVAGLGQNPDDVQLDGGVNVNADWMPGANATCNFWRSLENFADVPTADRGTMRIAVSQAAPMRRLHVKGDLDLYAWSHNGGVGWASGGFLADSIVDGRVGAGSQQQWISRNSTWSHWSNAVWNMVFVGCENTPENTFPNPPYTVVNKTPVIREKPYLYIDDRGAYRVFVPALRTDSQGASWANGPTPGDSLPIDRFYVAHADTSTSAALNAALAAGKSILFTPGIYSLDEPLRVTHANTILLGLGLPSLVPTTGASVISVGDVGGVKIGGLILDAGPVDSAHLLQIGLPGSRADHAANPTFLYDLTVRTGGPAPAKNDVGIEINSNDVVADQIWVWRADHGNGVGWTTNPTKHGLVVNGNDVTVYGLFNEHHCEYQTLWNGNGGRVYMYQSEMPYDVPSQSAWMSGTGGRTTDGFASYKVADSVTTHEAWGVGVYCFFRDAPITAHSAIEAPAAPGVRFHGLTTVWLNGNPESAIAHIIDDAGGTVDGSHSRRVVRQTLAEYP